MIGFLCINILRHAVMRDPKIPGEAKITPHTRLYLFDSVCWLCSCGCQYTSCPSLTCQNFDASHVLTGFSGLKTDTNPTASQRNTMHRFKPSILHNPHLLGHLLLLPLHYHPFCTLAVSQYVQCARRPSQLRKNWKRCRPWSVWSTHDAHLHQI